jgi:large subunit ribosomal protein L3
MGRKVGMTQIFSEDGKAIPVTVLEVGPCFVVSHRNKDRDGYEAVQLGYMPYADRDVRRVKDIQKLHEQRRANRDAGGKMKDRSEIKSEPRGPHRLTMAVYGHFNKRGMEPLRYLKEFHVSEMANFPEGKEIRADIFEVGDKVNISGTSKGRGFAGVIKKYHFRGGNATHGSMFHRKPASSGATDAARIFPGARRPGHMGAEQVTIQGLTIVRTDGETNMLAVRGAVPGPNGGLVVVTMPDRQYRERGKGKYITFTTMEQV